MVTIPEAQNRLVKHHSNCQGILGVETGMQTYSTVQWLHSCHSGRWWVQYDQKRGRHCDSQPSCGAGEQSSTVLWSVCKSRGRQNINIGSDSSDSGLGSARSLTCCVTWGLREDSNMVGPHHAAVEGLNGALHSTATPVSISPGSETQGHTAC